jgi:hypothetical protein
MSMVFFLLGYGVKWLFVRGQIDEGSPDDFFSSQSSTPIGDDGQRYVADSTGTARYVGGQSADFSLGKVQALPLNWKKKVSALRTVSENILGPKKVPATRLLISARVG